MEHLIEKLSLFYSVDQSTWLLIAFFCGWAAYFTRLYLKNAAVLVFLYPLFLAASMTAYATAQYFELFSPKKHSEWIMYTIFAAAIGATVGIGLTTLLRQIQDRFVTVSHIRRTLKRDEEQEAKGYPLADI